MSKIKRLSKSAFKDGRKCPKRLWLKWNNPELLKVDETLASRAALGEKVGVLARDLNPWGTLVAGETTSERLGETQRLLHEGVETLYEAAFEWDGLYAQVDILYKTEDGWGIREVKAAKSINDNNKLDAIFQYLVVSRSGLNVTRVELVLIAQDAPSITESKAKDLLVVQDMTSIAQKDADDLLPHINQLRTTFEKGEAEKIEPGRHCETSCPFYDHCFKNLPDDDLLFAPNLDKRKYMEYRSAGFRTLSELPDTITLSDRAERVRQILKLGEFPYVPFNLGLELSKIRFPAIFLDFETAAPMFPVNPGMRGGELVVFQYSAHVLSEPGGVLAHFEFLDLLSDDPHQALVDSLIPVFKAGGSVIHFSPFEKRCLNRLVAAGVNGAQELLGHFLRSSVDLEKFFKDGVYHPRFRGKSSIKVVLPIMVPGFDYSDLEVNNGGMAEMSYILARSGELVGDELLRRHKALLAYCKRDTEAMVMLYNKLLELSK